MRKAHITLHDTGSPDNAGVIGLMAAMCNNILLAVDNRIITAGGPYADARRWQNAITTVPLPANWSVLSDMEIAWKGRIYI